MLKVTGCTSKVDLSNLVTYLNHTPDSSGAWFGVGATSNTTKIHIYQRLDCVFKNTITILNFAMNMIGETYI